MPDPPAVTGESAERWRAVRRVLTAHRHELGLVAARLYPEVPRAASADLLCREEWVPAEPLGLDDLALHWDSGGPGQQGDSGSPDGRAGTERYAKASLGVRPARPDGARYRTYTEAVAALDRPALFENRPCYRLLGARLTPPAGLRLAETSYFEGIDLGHAVAHELAAASERSGRSAMRTASPERCQAAASSCATAWPRSIPSK